MEPSTNYHIFYTVRSLAERDPLDEANLETFFMRERHQDLRVLSSSFRKKWNSVEAQDAREQCMLLELSACVRIWLRLQGHLDHLAEHLEEELACHDDLCTGITQEYMGPCIYAL